MRPIFVGGCPRSGTTLLGALLGAHSRCVCVPEMPFKIDPLLFAHARRGNCSPREFAALIQNHRYFQNWGIEAHAADGGRAGHTLTYLEFIDDLVARYARAVEQDEADVWVDHTPDNVLRVRTLLDTFPDALFLHLVRDGRAVAASLLPLRWSVSSVFSAARVWAEHLGFGLAAEIQEPERVRRVVFEELVRDPQRVLAEICDFAQLEPEKQVGTRTRFRIPAETLYQHTLVSRPPDPSRAQGWRTTLSPRQIETFESVAGNLLAHLDYELLFKGMAAPATKREKVNNSIVESLEGIQLLGWRALDHLRGRLRWLHWRQNTPRMIASKER